MVDSGRCVVDHGPESKNSGYVVGGAVNGRGQ
jgi:hypothetical protein